MTSRKFKQQQRKAKQEVPGRTFSSLQMSAMNGFKLSVTFGFSS